MPILKTKIDQKKIILIEPDDFLSEIYSAKFRQEGFKVKRAADGEQGLKLIEREKPDIILLDILLPKKDGFEVIKELKSKSGYNKIPIIVVTNLGQKYDVSKALSLGAADYIIKAHFVPSETIATIKKLLKIKSSRQAGTTLKGGDNK